MYALRVWLGKLIGLNIFFGKIYMFDDLYKVGNSTFNESAFLESSLKLHSKNKAIAISKYNYGPLDPSMDIKPKVNIENIMYDRDKLYSFDEDDIFLNNKSLRESPNYNFWKTYF
jgi:hypothetical protein